MDHPIFTGALFYAGPAFSLLLQASNAQTAFKILSERSVGKLSAFPFVSLFANSVVWSLYGAIQESLTVILPNAIGVFIGLACIAAYESTSKSSNAQLYFCCLMLVATAVALAINQYTTTLGYLGCTMSIVLAGAPLSNITTVLREKSTASIPFTMSVASFFNAASWSSYGLIIENDPVIYCPGLTGLVLASIQLMLFVLYGFPKQSVSHHHHHHVSTASQDSKVHPNNTSSSSSNNNSSIGSNTAVVGNRGRTHSASADVRHV